MNAAQRIDSYLRQHRSPLTGLGQVFVREGQHNGIDPFLLVAISGAESSFATTGLSGAHNPFGWGPGHNFGSFERAIATVAHGLRTGYANAGLKTIAQIGQKWAPVGAGNDPTNLNSNWVKNVSHIYKQLGGTGFSDTGAGDSPSTPAPASGPDLSVFAFQNLSDLAAGEKLDPVKTLANLAFSVRTASPAAGPDIGSATGGYVNPLGGLKYKLGRTDQGLDIDVDPTQVGSPIAAMGDAKIVAVSRNYQGYGQYIAYKLLSGPNRGQVIFVGHSRVANVKVGQRVRAGQPVAFVQGFGASPGHLEIGFASQKDPYVTLGRAQGDVDPHTHYSSAGAAFAAWWRKAFG